MFGRISRRVRAICQKEKVEAELEIELRDHLERQIRLNTANGMNSDDARYAALNSFGGVEQAKEHCREARRVRFFEETVHDIRHGVRVLLRSPGFTLVSIAALALGIGANTAIFSVVNAVLLHPLPYSDPERLIALSETHPQIPKLEATIPDFLDWQSQNRSFDAVAAYTFKGFKDFVLTGMGEPEQLQGTLTTGNLFKLLGVSPAIGRTFAPDEEKAGHDHVALISHGLWQRRFGSDSNVAGKTIQLNGESFSIIGVMGDKQFPLGADVWIPLSTISPENTATRKFHTVAVIGRLKPETTLQAATADIASINEQLQRDYPATNKRIGVSLEPFREQFVGNLRTALFVLLGSVGLVLLIACANIANLLLSRAATRSKETAIRTALGASRSRLIRQFLTESILLALAGSIGGLFLAVWAIPLIRSAMPDVTAIQFPGMDQFGVDLRVLSFTLIIGLVTGVLFGIVPAFQASKTDINENLKQEGRNSATATRKGARNVLIIAEVALALVVLAGAGLLLRTFQHLMHVDPGFRTDHLLTVQLALPDSKYSTPESLSGFYQQLFTRIHGLAGIKAIAAINAVPLTPSHNQTRFAVEGQPSPEAGQYPVAQIRGISPDYFEVMGIRLTSGRNITEADVRDVNNNSFVINQTLARQFFPGEDPVGKKLLLGVLTPKPTQFRIIGVVADVKDLGVDAPVEPEIYSPGVGNNATILVRTETDPNSLAAAVRKEVLAVDNDQPVFQTRSIDEILSASLARRSFSAMLLSIFSLLALFLAAIGIYGVMAYSVTQRTREIGLRVALGARSGSILSMVLRQGMRPVLIGLASGLVGALLLTNMLSSLLYGVSANDPMTFAGVSALLSAISFLAICVPAIRACRIDPMAALRGD